MHEARDLVHTPTFYTSACNSCLLVKKKMKERFVLQTKGLAPFTYTVKLGKSLVLWPSYVSRSDQTWHETKLHALDHLEPFWAHLEPFGLETKLDYLLQGTLTKKHFAF